MPEIGTPIVNHANKYCISNFQDEREILFFKKLQACLATQVGNQKSLQLEQKKD